MATTTDRPVVLTLYPDQTPTTCEYRDEQGRTYLAIRLSPEMNDIIEDLARKGGVSKIEILNRGVGLYKAVSDAVRDGKRVGIIDDPDVEFDTEFVGF